MLRSLLKLLKNYYATPKGRHDINDYARAAVLIVIVSVIISLILAYFIL